MFRRLLAVRPRGRPPGRWAAMVAWLAEHRGVARAGAAVLMHCVAVLMIAGVVAPAGDKVGGAWVVRAILGTVALLAGEGLLVWPLMRKPDEAPEKRQEATGRGDSAEEDGSGRPALTLVGPGGPRVVAVGGGHGLSTLLRGLKAYTDELTAIVTVADDGGSSGVLRQELGLPPPGDLRDCIAALADAEPLMRLLFEYRFGRDTRLDGHSFGNLIIAALTGITGDFESAVSAASRVLAVRGRILPSTLDNVELCAEVRYGEGSSGRAGLVRGQSSIAAGPGAVERVFIQPATVKAHPEAIRALLQADLIVMGPGSLYTSVLPNLLIPGIADAIRAAEALRVYVCNVATQPSETAGYDLEAHVRALVDHVGEGICDLVVANHDVRHTLPASSGSQMVVPRWSSDLGPRLILRDLVDVELPWRHDPLKLAEVLVEQYRAHKGDLAAHATA